MSRSPGKVARGIVSVVALLIVFVLVRNYWGDYARSKSSDQPGSETTASVEPTATDDGGGDEGGDSGDAGGTGENQQSSQGTVVILTEGVNFRRGPSTDADLIDGLRKDQRLEYLGKEDSWYKVRASDGTEGYVSANELYTRLEQ